MSLATVTEANTLASGATDLWTATVANEKGDFTLFNTSGSDVTVVIQFNDGTNTATLYDNVLGTKERISGKDFMLDIGAKIIVTVGTGSVIEWSVQRKTHG